MWPQLSATHGRGAYSLELPPAPVNPPPPPGETNPSASLKKVKAVREGKKTKVRGTATDDGGLESVTVKAQEVALKAHGFDGFVRFSAPRVGHGNVCSGHARATDQPGPARRHR